MKYKEKNKTQGQTNLNKTRGKHLSK